MVSLSDESSPDLAIIESELKGKTLIVYWHLLKQAHAPIGVRKIQRDLGFSSPSVAAHHLEKLRSLGLVSKSPIGEYKLTQEVKVGVLRFFTKLGRFLIPRYLFYSVFFTTMFIAYLLLYPQTLTVHNIIADLFGIMASGILWFETVRVWRERPF